MLQRLVAPLWAKRFLSAWKRLDQQALRFVLIVFLASRVLVVLASVLAVTLLPPDAHALAPGGEIWLRWDATHYLAIAAKGYVPTQVQGQGLTSPAFFPLYPLVMKVGSVFTLGNLYLAALLINGIALFVALYQLFLLARADFGLVVARGAVLAFVAFPTAFFLFVPYAEALFVALAIGAVRAMRLHHWAVAAVLGMLAALTRQAGLILILPFAWEWFRVWSQGRTSGPQQAPATVTTSREDQPTQRIKTWLARSAPVLWLALIPTGTVCYALWLWHAVGDPLAFLHAQAAWTRHWDFPLFSIWHGLQYALSPIQPFFAFRGWLDLMAVLVMGVLAIIGLKMLPALYSIYTIPLYLIFLSQPERGWALISQARFMLELFPLFIVLGAIIIRHRVALLGYLASGGILQLGLMAMFARGGWIT